MSAHLLKACADGQTAGPFNHAPFADIQCSGVGTVPKKNGKLRVIHHLSAHEGGSINDGISSTEFSLKYIRIDDAVETILRLGRGCFLTKLDIRSAFRLIPVRPEDWSLLGIHWDNKFYFEKVLPFELRSSSCIFNQVANAIEWIVKEVFKVPEVLHYLDDYLNIAPPNMHLAKSQQDFILAAFDYLGVPLAREKVEGPVTELTFLGISLDTVMMEARLPADKLTEIRALLQQVGAGRDTTPAKFDSFVGKLSFAATVVVPGSTFMRRLWDVTKRFHKVPGHYRIVLSAECRKDIRWWKRLVEDWNGKAFFLFRDETPASELGLYTDASGLIRWGAYYGQEGRWMLGRWSKEQQQLSIEYKELYAVLVACSTWCHKWSRRRIVIHCDHQAVVACISSGTSKSPYVMSLLRQLFYVCAKHDFLVVAYYVAGKANVIADALSRVNLQVFRQAAPAARLLPDCPVSPPLME